MNTYSNFQKNDETKVMRDPIHGYIYVDYKLIWDLIDTPEFQRLRRIHQLGGTHQVYHSAEHSRFSHSVGVYELVRQIVDKVPNLRESMTDLEYMAVLCAGLLHDVGHGPFSHAFEEVTSINHEDFTTQIITGDTEINKLLKETHTDLPDMVASIINHTYPNKKLTQIISSQLDADRMDYLLRDSYFTGVSYGEFDLNRILRTMRVEDEMIVVKESGIHAIEDYILARYQMYWQVYLHPTSRSFEAILHSIFSRLKDVYKSNPEIVDSLKYLKPFISGEYITLKDHLFLDETTCMTNFMDLIDSKDEILKDLTTRIIGRNLFQYVDYENEEQLNNIKELVASHGYDVNYYVVVDDPIQTTYHPYRTQEQMIENIMVHTKQNELKELSEVSEIVKGFIYTQKTGIVKEDKKIFFPKEIKYETKYA